jgi:hypothetical protein
MYNILMDKELPIYERPISLSGIIRWFSMSKIFTVVQFFSSIGTIFFLLMSMFFLATFPVAMIVSIPAFFACAYMAGK